MIKINSYGELKKLNNNKIKILHIYGHFNFSLIEQYDCENIITNLEELIIRSDFSNYPDNFLLGYKLKFLHIDGSFDNPIDNLPITLKHLILIGKFSNNLDNLPTNLIKLKFTKGSKYNHPLDNLPNSLIILILDLLNYDHNFHNLPNSLKFLSLPYKNSNSIENLPHNLINFNI